jgi:CysZ protein
MDLLRGMTYNLKGLKLGLKTPRLLMLGIIRVVIVVALTLIAISLILVYHQDLLEIIWQKPTSPWLVWLWYLASWLVALALIGLSAIVSYLAAQILFAVLIMDMMSRITEKLITGGKPVEPPGSIFKQFYFLMLQEIPRALVPILLLLVVMFAAWLTPIGPIVSIVTTIMSIIFLAWDNTDLTPARRLMPFSDRFKFLMRTVLFHLGFGLWFLIPILNIVFLSFAPIGATMYYVEHHNQT